MRTPLWPLFLLLPKNHPEKGLHSSSHHAFFMVLQNTFYSVREQRKRRRGEEWEEGQKEEEEDRRGLPSVFSERKLCSENTLI